HYFPTSIAADRPQAAEPAGRNYHWKRSPLWRLPAMGLGLNTPAEILTKNVPDPLLCDSGGLCQILGCSPATLFRRKSAGQLLPGIKWGGKLLWRLDEVKAWVAAGMPDAETWLAMQEASRRR